MATQEELLKTFPKEQIALNPDLLKPEFQAPGVITGANLAPITAPEFKIPTPTPITSPDTIDTTIAKTAEPTLSSSEQRISDLIGQITKGQEAAAGQIAFKTERRATEGLPALEKTQEDIAEQILMLQGQAKALEISPEFERRGTLQPFAEGERGRALRDVGVKSNILSAQLLASQGKVASANARIDRAVLEKFGPQEEAIKAKIFNLEFFLKDPAITLAEKNRANAQLLIQKREEAEVAKKKQDTADAWKVLTESSTNIQNFQPTAQYTTPALAQEAIRKAGEKGDKVEALRIATETGLTRKAAEPTGLGDIFEFKALFPNVDITTPAGRQQFLTFRAQKAAAGRKGEEAGFITIVDPITGETKTVSIKDLTSPQQTRLDAINTVSSQLQNYRNLVDRYTGVTGAKLTGTKAAELRTAKSTLEFAIANAVGTGALQSADRAVVRDLLPDPTSVSGAIGGAIRGGKKGNLAAIDQAQSIFTSARNTILTGTQTAITGQTKPEKLRSKYNY